MPVTKEDIQRTAELARLRLSPAELDDMTSTLGKVFQYIDQLHEVDTTGGCASRERRRNSWRSAGFSTGCGNSSTEARPRVCKLVKRLDIGGFFL